MIPVGLAAQRNLMMSNAIRSFSVTNAYGIKSKFETAYDAKMEAMSTIQVKMPQAADKVTYGSSYYNEDRIKHMKVGYVHPYHSEGSPVYMSNLYFLKNLHQAVGPE